MKGKIFNAQEVQSILSGNKTQFREVVKKPRHETLQDCIYKGQLKAKGFQVYFENPKVRWLGPDMPTGITIRCPYQIGQKIFCKESFIIAADPKLLNESNIFYKAEVFGSDWKPAQHMKQEHSRLTLQIKEIRVERLADISEKDAIAEGNYLDRCECLSCKKHKSPFDVMVDAMFKQNWCHIHGQEFKNNWNATHKKLEEKWEANPWVWCINFEVVNANK